MASNPVPMVNVPPRITTINSDTNGMNGVSRASVDRALQYTPFAIPVLPVIDRIPIPEVSRVRENGRVATSNERKRAQEILQHEKLQPAIGNQISSLLNRESTEYKFRLPPSSSASNKKTARPSLDLGLSPLARSVFEMANPEYRYPTPDDEDGTVVIWTPKKPRQSNQSTPATSNPVNALAPSAKTPITTSTASQLDTKDPALQATPRPVATAYSQHSKTADFPTPAISEIAAVQRNSELFHSNSVGSSTPLNGKPVVIAPPLPAKYRREDYETIERSPKRRKHSDDESQAARTQKQQSDEALQSFEDLLSDVFEGQDLLDLSGENHPHAKSSQYFDTSGVCLEDGLALNTRTLDKLCDEMKKLLALRRLQDIQLDHLRRLQQICENSVERGQTMNVRPDDQSDDGASGWKYQLTRACTCVSSAIVSLYIMIGNPQQEQLLSTETLRWTANTLVNILDNCVIPVVEARPEARDNSVFQLAVLSAEAIKRLLGGCKVLLDLMTTACTEVKGGDFCVNTVEFLAAKLIFVQNAVNDKTSALAGVAVYEGFRKSAMASLSRLYARFPRERSAILDEVLSSLDKLPSTSRSARTYRAGNGKSIQLISALFMQLVQTTAMDVPAKSQSMVRSKARKGKTHESDAGDDGDILVDHNLKDEDDSDDLQEDKDDILGQLAKKVRQLFAPASKSAQEIGLYLLSKASKTTKTGDSPYRSILDLLVEDLINVLDSFEWPSADLILNVIAAKMLNIAQYEKAASTKNMALESLGSMASAISRFRAKLTIDVNSISREGSQPAMELVRLSEMYLQTGVPVRDLFALSGPFVMTVESFPQVLGRNTLHQQSARAYFVAQLGQHVSQMVQKDANEIDPTDVAEYVVRKLSGLDVSTNTNIQMSRDESEVAYLLCILHQGFCRRLHSIGRALSASLSSDQAQVRSRSLKSIAVMLEIDSSLLNGTDTSIADDIFRCASDESAMVRDSALSVIARFILPRGGALEKKSFEKLLQCTEDEKVGVQKRSIGHLKDMFFHDKRLIVRLRIARKLLPRLNDTEASIMALAEQTLEDIWMKPALALLQKDENAAASIVAIQDLASHLVACVGAERSTYDTFVPLLRTFFISLLRPHNKSRAHNHQLCCKLVDNLFEKIMSAEEGRQSLVVLHALADADPQLVPASQLAKLRVYLSDMQKRDSDLLMFRSAVGIFRLVLPSLSEIHQTLLKDVQDSLMKSLNLLPSRQELDAVMQCLWTIDGVLKNTTRLVVLCRSCLDGIAKAKDQRALVKLIRIVGSLAKHVDLDKSVRLFASSVPDFKGKSVAAYVCTTLLPMTAAGQEQAVRVVALESLGCICQASPAQFNDPRVNSALFNILKLPPSSPASGDYGLRSTVLSIFDELYAARAASKAKADEAEADEQQALKQIGGNAKSRDQDSAIAAITPKVLEAVLKISLSEVGRNALIAATTLASIARSGLTHPQQCLGAFVAFGTSTDSNLATVGHKAQRYLHEQHESHCERAYPAAITKAFEYQAGIVQEPSGARQVAQMGIRPKLAYCLDIVSTSNTKYVKKFLSGVVSRTALESNNFEQSPISVEHVMFTRFVVQNIAFTEYKKLDELLHVVYQLELTYGKSGTEVAAMIESVQQQHPNLLVPAEVSAEVADFGVTPIINGSQTMDPVLVPRLKALSTAAACLLMLIEARAHLIRQYGIGRDVRAAITSNKQAKETNKNPMKVHGITGDKFWTRSNNIVNSLHAEMGTIKLCHDFLEAMNVDEDTELAVDQAMSIEAPMDGDMHSAQQITTPGGRKRKRSGTPGTTPSKRPKGRPRKSLQRRSSSISSTNEDPDADFEG